MHDTSFQYHEVLYANVVLSAARHVLGFARNKEQKKNSFLRQCRADVGLLRAVCRAQSEGVAG